MSLHPDQYDPCRYARCNGHDGMTCDRKVVYVKKRVAALQFDIVHGNPSLNRARVKKLLHEALGSQPRPDIAVLPETWTTGYSRRVFREIRSYAETLNGSSVNLLRRFAEEYGVTIIGGTLPIVTDQAVTNTSLVIGPDGRILGRYDKMHLYSAVFAEHEAFKSGKDLPVIDTPLGAVSVMTCYDLRFPEVCRTFALKGSRVVFVPSNFPKPKLEHWRVLVRARAIENQVFVVAVNRCGRHEEAEYFGHSLVVSPWGEIVAEAGEKEEILYADLEMNQIAEVRNTIPVFSDRHPESYPSAVLCGAYDGHRYDGTR